MQHIEHIGNKIKAYRMRRGWSQLTFANRVGITRESVCNAETGRNTPRDLTVARIRIALPDFDRGEAA
jgi:DNA-binding XRE family transcriptional regulator